MSAREQVADLQPGDVVELRFPSGSTIRGPLTTAESYGPGLGIPDAGWTVRDRDGNPGWFTSLGATLTVVSRAPRPLYVNHPRTEPAPGDVVRDADACESDVWMAGTDYNGDHCWVDPERLVSVGKRMPRPSVRRLRLLVDGETGQVVQ